MIDSLGSALVLALSWENFLFVGVGVAVGVAFGAIPGLTGSIAVALLLPFTFFVSPVAAISLLLGAYKGSMFGGSISAITFGVPGTPGAAATVADGYALTKQGKPFKALNTALYSSVASDWLTDLVVIFTFVPIGIIALKFGPRELFALMVAALIVLIIFSATSPLKGIISAMVGFFFASIGLDPIMALSRLDFGIRQFQTGITLLPFLIGLFAFSEMLFQFSEAFPQRFEEKSRKALGLKRSPQDRLSVKEWLTYWREVLIGAGMGVFLGAVPGPGATMSAFTSYAMASRLPKNRGRFGTGAPEGVAAAEAGNSGTVGPTLIPLFAFGIPGSGLAALFMGAFILQGITPGPGMIYDHMDVMLAIFMIMILANVFNLVISKVVMIPIFTQVGLLSTRVLVPVVVPLMMVGIYAMRTSWFDVLIMAGAGLLGIVLRRFQVPLVPCVVAFMIGPLVEMHFRQGLVIANSPMYWFASPIALGLYIAAIVMACLVLYRRPGKV